MNACVAAADAACPKMVSDMLYKARLQAVITWHANHDTIVKKPQARNIYLTKEEYMTVNILTYSISV